jgi:2-furoate---CoA ligase
MIITGGENVSPVEIESCLSLHPAVSEVAVAGLPDERWGKIVAAFVKRRAAVEADELDAFCRSSASPASSARGAMSSSPRFRNRRSASCLRRKLVAGEYHRTARRPASQQGTAA